MLLSFDPGIVNFGFAVIDIDTRTPVHSGVLNIKHRLHKGVLKRLVSALDEIVSSVEDPSDITTIMVEKQIGRNAKMRQIETAIVTYFETMNMYCVHGMTVEIILYLAYNKFKTPIDGFEFIPDLIGKKNYRMRKKETQRCAMYLFDVKYPFDVADCIIQAYCYLSKA